MRTRRLNGKRRSRWYKGALLGVPGLVLYGTIILVPIVLTFRFSLTRWDGIQEPVFVGFENYVRAFTSGDILRAGYVSLVLSVSLTLALNILGLYFAHKLVSSGKSIIAFRAVFFFPVILAPVLVGFLWRQILSTGSAGVMNNSLQNLGLEPVSFLGDPDLALVSLVAVSLWHIVGFTVIIYIAGLLTIRKDLIEAARLEGAEGWKLFRYVTFPLVAPAFTINTIVILTLGAREYDRILSLTGGGPARQTESLTFLIIQEGFGRTRLGYSSSIAMYVLAVVAVLAAIALIKLRQREEHVA